MIKKFLGVVIGIAMLLLLWSTGEPLTEEAEKLSTWVFLISMAVMLLSVVVIAYIEKKEERGEVDD